MERLVAFVAGFDRRAGRLGPLFNLLGWVCFALICADYARFIDLPSLAIVPAWLGALQAVARWAVWEGLVKPRLQTIRDPQPGTEGPQPPPPASD